MVNLCVRCGHKKTMHNKKLKCLEFRKLKAEGKSIEFCECPHFEEREAI